LARAGFVLITSQTDAHEANLLSPAGNVVRLSKPFNLDQLGEALAAATGRPAWGSDSRPSRTGSSPPLRVLLVDDSTSARSHIRGVLAGLGLRQVTEAADGAEAMTVLGKETFDLVITDYNMPHLDGRGLLEFIRHRSSVPAVPVIVVTTETDPAKLDAMRQLGVSAICDKSFKPDVVRGVLARLGHEV